MTLDDFLNGSWTIRDLRAGPFRDCIDLYTARLRKDGYSTVTARYSVRIVNCFIRWLTEHHFDRGDIDEQLAARFFEDEVRGCSLRGNGRGNVFTPPIVPAISSGRRLDRERSCGLRPLGKKVALYSAADLSFGRAA